MPNEMMAEHLEGFSCFVRQFIHNSDKLLYTLSRIRYVRMVLGCVITPGFDEGGTMQDFVFHFNTRLNGLLFISDTIFDYDAEPLGGPLAAQN
jgi:hypothetical protein